MDPGAHAPLLLVGQPPPSITSPLTFGFGIAVAFVLRFLRVEDMLQTLPLSKGQLFALFVVCTGLVNGYCSGLVAYARSQLKVPLPFAYPAPQDIPDVSASDRHTFLCTFRVHENYLEFLPQMLAVTAVATFVCGFSALAPLLGLIWCAGRFLYALGYSSGVPAKRLPGLFLSLFPYFAQHGLVVLWIIY
jgi:glutathione S-transferase